MDVGSTPKIMKKTFLVLLILCLSVSVHTTSEPQWGFFGHRHIGRLAVFTLPPEMIGFYKENIEWITEHSPDPDRRRYAIKVEAPRHYIDLDRWGEPPFPELTRDWLTDAMRHTDISILAEDGDTISIVNAKEIDWEAPKIRVWRYMIPIKKYSNFFKYNILNKTNYSCTSIDGLRKNANFPCGELIVKDHLFEDGLNPYYTEYLIDQLSKAFANKDVSRILHRSADLGHYIADGHVPLHTTENYNGQLTGQVGIHAFWESRIPELFADQEYDYFVGKADYVSNTREWIWDYVTKSHSYVDSVLVIEQHLRDHYPADEQMCFEQKNAIMLKTQCKDFAKAYEIALDGMVEDRFRKAIHSVGSAWYTAWVNGGRPNLDILDVDLVKAEKDTLEQYYRAGNIKGRSHWD